MLIRKLFRDMKSNPMQFIAIFFLAFMSVFVFSGTTSSNEGAVKVRNEYHKDTNLANGWIYGNNFSDEDLDKIEEISDISNAQLRAEVDTVADEDGEPTIYLYGESKNEITKPYLIDGQEYDVNDDEGIWIDYRYAEKRELSIGEKYKLKVNDKELEKEIKGFIITPEYEYIRLSTDLETDFSHVGYAYVSYDTLKEELNVKYNQIIFTTDKEDVLSLEDNIADALDNRYNLFVDRDSVSGLRALEEEIDQHQTMAYIFPSIMVIIALLAIMTTMSRLISGQRVQIGTMKALGVKDGKIIRHYLSYSFFVSFVGAALGLILGPSLLGKMMCDIMESSYTLPQWKIGYSPLFFIVAAIVVITATLATYISCKKLMNVNPAETLRPSQPKSAKPCVFEKLPFWEKLTFTVRYNLRDMSRSKLRAIMTLFGAISGMLMITGGLGIYSTVANSKEISFSKIQNYEYQLFIDNKAKIEDVEEIRDSLDGELVMQGAIGITKDKDNGDLKKENTQILVNENKGLYKIIDEDFENVNMSKDDIAITQKLAEKLNVSKGDTVDWHMMGSDQWFTSKITVINRDVQFAGITMSRSYFENIQSDLNKEDVYKFKPSYCISNEDCSDYSNDDIISIYNKSEREASFDNMMSTLNIMIGIMFFGAFAITVLILYNAGILSFIERQKELATIKVMGMDTVKLRVLLLQQNLWISVVGVIIGAPIGKSLVTWMFNSNGDATDFFINIAPMYYIFAGVLVIALGLLVSYLFSGKLKKLDLVSTLKGIE